VTYLILLISTFDSDVCGRTADALVLPHAVRDERATPVARNWIDPISVCALQQPKVLESAELHNQTSVDLQPNR
jgi:hypothetical protein